MARYQSIYRTRTLESSLEAITHLGEGYLLTNSDEEWLASDLLELLQSDHPDLLSLPVALVPPDAIGDGAVFAVDLEGEAIINVPLYLIERRKPTVYPL